MRARACLVRRAAELRKYRLRPELTPHFDARDLVCTIKQHVWQRYQQPLLTRRAAAAAAAAPAAAARAGVGAAAAASASPLLTTVAFDSFRTHPMWRASDERANLTIKRTAGGCTQLLRASTPLRSQRRVREWLAIADDAVRRSGFA